MTPLRPKTFRRPETRSNRERGFSLLEVLIALLVLSIGLLGIAGLQTVSLRFNHQSYERTQATVLISEMIEKIMANPVAARGVSFDAVDTFSGVFTGYGACPASCSSDELATYDLSRWKSSIDDPRRLAQGRGTIERVLTPLVGTATQHVFNVKVFWIENNLQMTQGMQVRTQRNQ
jgi:type IV pilus assembly protein PilV